MNLAPWNGTFCLPATYMDHEFKHDEVSEQELKPLLHELHEQGSWISQLEPEGSDDEVTVAAVADATGLPVAYVQAALDRLRESDSVTRLSRAVKELEEPLYRVERPGLSQVDPLDRHFRQKYPVEAESDKAKLKQLREALRVQRKKDAMKVTTTESVTTIAILIGFFVVFLGISVIALTNIFSQIGR